MVKSDAHDVCALFIENFKVIFIKEIKKEIDERVNSEKHMFQQQITSLKQVNLYIQNDWEELKQFGKLYLIIMSRTSFRVNPYSIVCLNVKEPLLLV